MNNLHQNYEKSKLLRQEATDTNKVIIPEIWDAIVERELAVDLIVYSGSLNKSEALKFTDFFKKAINVRKLQEQYGIEQS